MEAVLRRIIRPATVKDVNDDEERTRMVRLLNAILIIALMLSLGYVAASVIWQFNVGYRFVVGVIALVSFMLILLRLGYVKAVLHMLLLSMLGAALILSLINRGINATVVGLYFLPVIMSGLALSRRAGILFTSLTLTVLLGVALLDYGNVLGETLIDDVMIEWLVSAGSLGMAAYILRYIGDSRQKALNDARESARESAIFRAMAENATDTILMISSETYAFTYANPAAYRLFGYDAENQKVLDNINLFDILNGVNQGESILKRKDGTTFEGIVTRFPVLDRGQEAVADAIIIRDVTERNRLQQEIIDAQRHALQELSTPLIPVMDGVLVMPLLGTIDTARAQQMMETVLQSVASQHINVLIIDVTGVPLVDTSVANHLLKLAQAVGLLGAECVLVGIMPDVAQTIISLGVQMEVTTKRNLQDGLVYALRKMDRPFITDWVRSGSNGSSRP